MVFKTDKPLMQVKSIAECSERSILQYFRSSLSYHLSLKPLFYLFLSGCFSQVLLYVKPVLSNHLKIDKTKVILGNGSLMEVESIAKSSPWSILQYF